MTELGRPATRPSRAVRRLLAALVGLALLLAAIVVGAVPAAAQNGVGASTPVMINTVGVSADIGAGQRLGKTVPQPVIVVATGVAAKSGLGDLSSAEVRAIQSTVDQAGRPLDVVGSAARGERRGLGTDLPLGKGPGTRSDIDYVVPHGSVPFYESTGLYKNLPDLDQIIAGVHNPFIGPSVRFEPFADPVFVPGAQ